MATESVRIETEILERVRNHVAVTKQTISGFIELAIDEKLHGYTIGIDPHKRRASNGKLKVITKSTKGGKK